MKTVKIDDIASAIMDELLTYEQNVADGIKKDVKAVAKSCADELKSTSPKDTGEYADGWRAKKKFESREQVEYVIHNKDKYQITHLLEHAHKIGDTGKMSKPQPHIEKARQNAEKLLMKKVEFTIGKNSKN